jgi:hypothetical protein
MIKAFVLAIALVGFRVQAGLATNSIDLLAQRLNSSNGLWVNGTYPIISLSSNATPQEVLDAAAYARSWDAGSYRIVEIRRVELRDSPRSFRMRDTSEVVEPGKPTAVLIESDSGPKILLCYYQTNGLWWTRFFDVPKRAEPDGPANGSQPSRSATNQTPSAAGSRR